MTKPSNIQCKKCGYWMRIESATEIEYGVYECNECLDKEQEKKWNSKIS